MNILIYLVVAAVIGWVATMVMHDNSNLILNIIVAVIGAFLAGYFLSPIFHVGTINVWHQLSIDRGCICRRRDIGNHIAFVQWKKSISGFLKEYV
jgi:uncharacterized membrane protein YeaQ/YmgE (transglycosylase-associated protein family)